MNSAKRICIIRVSFKLKKEEGKNQSQKTYQILSITLKEGVRKPYLLTIIRLLDK
jgi:hypothetical protein